MNKINNQKIDYQKYFQALQFLGLNEKAIFDDVLKAQDEMISEIISMNSKVSYDDPFYDESQKKLQKIREVMDVI